MTRAELDAYLLRAYDGDVSRVARFHAWLDRQPAKIRELAHEFPVGTTVYLTAGERYVIGWDVGFVLVSPVRLREDRHRAMAAATAIPVGMLRGTA